MPRHFLATDVASRLLRRAGSWLVAQAMAERDRWPLVVPVLLAIGTGGYFALPSEPPAWAGVAATVAALLLLVPAWRLATARLALLAVVIAGVGFAAAQVRTLAAPPMPGLDTRGPAAVEGRVVGIERRAAGVRMILDEVAIEDVEPARTPTRIRLVAQGWKANQPALGDRVRVLAEVRSPPGPAAPGAYDFAREAFFAGLGGVGFVYGGGAVLVPGRDRESPALRVASLRLAIGDRVRAVLPGTTGAVATALLTGERTAIPESVNQAMRDSGLFHLLSISGLHLALIAGLLYGGVRLTIAAIEPVTLRWPGKKPAAFVALVGTAGYLLLSGAAVPTQRAFVMAGLALVAVMLGRSPFSMRLVAFAAVVILLTAPQSLLGASFQLSFAAVVALIAVWEEVSDRGLFATSRGRPLARAGLWIAGLLLTSAVAGVATAPATAYHFNRVALYGIAANLVAVPITGFVVMPAALASLALMPLGWEPLPLRLMGSGIDLILAVAERIAGWPWSVVRVPEVPFPAYLAMVVGGAWLCLWRRRWRALGAVPIAVGVGLTLLHSGPDLLIDGEARLVALRGPDGLMALSDRRTSRLTAESWLRRAGRSEWAPWPAADGSTAWLACDSLGCLYRREGRTLAIVRHPAALAEDCATADVVVATFPVRGPCEAPIVIDRFDLWRRGAHAVWVGEDSIRALSVADVRGDRPWVIDPAGLRRSAGTGPPDDPES